MDSWFSSGKVYLSIPVSCYGNTTSKNVGRDCVVEDFKMMLLFLLLFLLTFWWWFPQPIEGGVNHQTQRVTAEFLKHQVYLWFRNPAGWSSWDLWRPINLDGPGPLIMWPKKCHVYRQNQRWIWANVGQVMLDFLWNRYNSKRGRKKVTFNQSWGWTLRFSVVSWG